MSFIDSEILPELFLGEFTDNILFHNNLSENNMNDLLNNSKTDKLKPIKFILTKEQNPVINLLQKKTNLKLSESDNVNGGRWNKDEQIRFAEAVLKYGNDWKKMQNYIFTRNITQVRSHAQKFLMKLKENNFAKNKGLDLSLSWTKVMNYLRSTLNYDELKYVLFSVEQNDGKNIVKKDIKKSKKRKLEENEAYESYNSSKSKCKTNEGNINFFFEDEKDRTKYNVKNKILINEEEQEKIILKKFIECFNSPPDQMTLNTSFEEESSKENETLYKFINDSPINYSNGLDNNI